MTDSVHDSEKTRVKLKLSRVAPSYSNGQPPSLVTWLVERVGLWVHCFRSLPDHHDLDNQRFFAGCRWIFNPFTEGYDRIRNFLTPRKSVRQCCQMAKFDPFLSLDCTWGGGCGAQSKERKGSNFAA